MKWNNTVVYAIWALQCTLFLTACQSGPVMQETRQPVEAASSAGESAMKISASATPEPTATFDPTVTPEPTAEPTVPQPSVVTMTVTMEVTPPPLGSSERPIQLLFPPVTSSAVIAQRAEPLVAALRAATGLEYVAGIPDNEAALVDLLCAAPADIIGFISAAAYVIAHEECGAQAGLVAVEEDGLTWQMGMLVVRPGEVDKLADLDGQRWAVADTHSLPNYLYFRAAMAEAGVEPAEVIDAPEETSALLALRDGEADFTSATYVPPIMPRDGTWIVGESDPEEWRLLGISPSRSPIGYVIVAAEPEFGGYRIRDARSRMFDTNPDIFDVTRILALSEPIPNETVVIGADFPLSLSRQATTTLTEFAASDACGASLCSADLFGWTGLAPVEDAAYDPIRTIKDTLELEAADLWAELD